jgi:hypothetical protein
MVFVCEWHQMEVKWCVGGTKWKGTAKMDGT